MTYQNKIVVIANKLSTTLLNFQIRTSKHITDDNIQISNLRKTNSILHKDIQKRVTGPKIARNYVGKIVWKSGLGRVWYKDIIELKQKLNTNTNEIEQIRKRIKIHETALKRINQLNIDCETIKRDAARLNFISMEFIKKIEFLGNQMTALIKDKLPALHEIALKIGELNTLLDTIHETITIKRSSKKIVSSTLPQRATPWNPVATRDIILPIPSGLHYSARQLGALTVKTQNESKLMYIPKNTDLHIFENFLPLGFRKNPTKFMFTPKEPEKSKSMNIHKLFDDATWSHIRNINYAKTSNRCVVCGGVSDDMLEIMDKSKIGRNRKGSVDCHEIWDWKQPYPEIPIGVQKLTALIIVCFKCHMAFHDDIAREFLLNKDDTAALTRSLHQHRSFMTGIDQQTLFNRMKLNNRIVNNLNKIELWILDLSHLSKQDYMIHVNPVFREGNNVGVEPRQIAGLSFKTDQGESWKNTSTKDIYRHYAPRFPTIDLNAFVSNNNRI